MNAQDTATAAAVFGEPIQTYSCANAFADGYLVDVTETACEAGFCFQIVLTRAAWNDCFRWSASTGRRTKPAACKQPQ